MRRLSRAFCPAVIGILMLQASFAAAYGVPVMIKDINPGAASSSPQKLLAIGNKLFFAGTNGVSGFEPMVSDGSEINTFPLRDITPGLLSGIVQGCPTCNAVASGATAYFSASEGSVSELWKTDGTIARTMKVYPGASASDLVDVGCQVYFAGTPVGFSAAYLFKSNGTAPGTSQVSTTTDLSGYGMFSFNGAPYFPAVGNGSGVELWKSDGTQVGTVVATDIAPGSASSYPSLLTRVGNALFFSANNGQGPGICVSNGTVAGSSYLKQITVGVLETKLGQIVDLNGTAMFIGDDVTHGLELWRSDGTEAGTVQPGVIYPGGASQADGFTEVNGVVYFSATDGVHGIKLWGVASPTAGVEPGVGAISNSARLSQGRPNPARSTTRIAYALAFPQRVRLVVFDALGRAVRTLEEGDLPAGSFEVELDGRDLPSGTYFYRLETATGSLQRKLLLTH